MRSISSYARSAFQWACGTSIITGTSNGRLSPKNMITREQLAMVLYRYSQLPKEEVPADEPAADNVTDAA